jgi:hypothetical protein
MPDVTVNRERLTAKQTASVLQEQLGDRYTVKVSSDTPDTLTVRRNAVERAVVRIRRSAHGSTHLEVRPQAPFLLNRLLISRHVTRALEGSYELRSSTLF